MKIVLYSIGGVLLLALVLGALRLIWKISRWLLLPVQILLFLILVAVAVKLLATKENVQRIDKTVREHIPEAEKTAISGEPADEQSN